MQASVLAPGGIPADNGGMRSRSHAPRRLGRALFVFLSTALLLPLAGCLSWTTPRPDLVWDRRPAGVSLSTTPPGAAVIIDGVASGYATPCIVDFDEDETYRVEFELNGYRTAGLYLTPHRRWFLVPYEDSTRGPRVWRFPLWFPLGEFFMPVRTNTALAPSRVHLRLRLGSDALEAPSSAAAEGRPGL